MLLAWVPEVLPRSPACNDQTSEDRLITALERTRALRKAGYHVVEAWACEAGKSDADCLGSKQQATRTRYRTISCRTGTKISKKEAKPTLTIENAHVPILVSVGYTLDLESIHICEKDTVEQVGKFMEEPDWRGKTSGPW